MMTERCVSQSGFSFSLKWEIQFYLIKQKKKCFNTFTTNFFLSTSTFAWNLGHSWSTRQRGFLFFCVDWKMLRSTKKKSFLIEERAKEKNKTKWNDVRRERNSPHWFCTLRKMFLLNGNVQDNVCWTSSPFSDGIVVERLVTYQWTRSK